MRQHWEDGKDSRVLHFRPFEHMAWAKGVPPGARYALHVSGLGAPPALDLPLPDWAEWTAPVAGPREALLFELRRYLGRRRRTASS